jgi:hypothetical protein
VNRDTTGRRSGSPSSEPEPAARPDDRLGQLAGDLGRLVDRLRSLSEVRLARPLPGRGSRADTAHALAQLLADHAAALSAEPSRPVPRLHDFAVGDQVAVTGNDLLAALRDRSEHSLASGQDDPADRLGDALRAVRELRSGL